MADEQRTSVPHARVNAALLQQFHGKAVCMLGTVIKADGGGTAFQMRGCDNGGPINIRLKNPISEPLSGLIEVYGIGQGKNLIVADSYTRFEDHVGSSFDLNTYNEAVKLLHTIDNNVWISG